MRGFVAALALAAAVVSAGCWQVSIHPFFNEATSLPGAGGRWVSEEEDPDTLELAEAGADTWTARLIEADGESSTALVRFGRVGGELFWDMTAEVPKTPGGLVALHLVPVHSVARVRLDGDRLEVTPLDSRWLAEAIADGRVGLACVDPDEKGGGDDVLLTASTAELEGFLASWGGDPEAFADTTVYHRAGEVPSVPEGERRD
jgi:hypothetical protein